MQTAMRDARVQLEILGVAAFGTTTGLGGRGAGGFANLSRIETVSLLELRELQISRSAPTWFVRPAVVNGTHRGEVIGLVMPVRDSGGREGVFGVGVAVSAMPGSPDDGDLAGLLQAIYQGFEAARRVCITPDQRVDPNGLISVDLSSLPTITTNATLTTPTGASPVDHINIDTATAQQVVPILLWAAPVSRSSANAIVLIGHDIGPPGAQAVSWPSLTQRVVHAIGALREQLTGLEQLRRNLELEFKSREKSFQHEMDKLNGALQTSRGNETTLRASLTNAQDENRNLQEQLILAKKNSGFLQSLQAALKAKEGKITELNEALRQWFDYRERVNQERTAREELWRDAWNRLEGDFDRQVRNTAEQQALARQWQIQAQQFHGLAASFHNYALELAGQGQLHQALNELKRHPVPDWQMPNRTELDAQVDVYLREQRPDSRAAPPAETNHSSPASLPGAPAPGAKKRVENEVMQRGSGQWVELAAVGFVGLAIGAATMAMVWFFSSDRFHKSPVRDGFADTAEVVRDNAPSLTAPPPIDLRSESPDRAQLDTRPTIGFALLCRPNNTRNANCTLKVRGEKDVQIDATPELQALLLSLVPGEEPQQPVTLTGLRWTKEGDLERKSIERLASLAKGAQTVLEILPDRVLTIGVHTALGGERQQNADLSYARAQTIAAVFLEAGVPSHRLSSLGLGSDRPIEDEPLKDDRDMNAAINDRVELTLEVRR